MHLVKVMNNWSHLPSNSFALFLPRSITKISTANRLPAIRPVAGNQGGNARQYGRRRASGAEKNEREMKIRGDSCVSHQPANASTTSHEVTHVTETHTPRSHHHRYRPCSYCSQRFRRPDLHHRQLDNDMDRRYSRRRWETSVCSQVPPRPYGLVTQPKLIHGASLGLLLP